MNWQQARTLAEQHQARFRDEPGCLEPPARAPHPRRARRYLGWALVGIGLRLAVGRHARSAAA